MAAHLLRFGLLVGIVGFPFVGCAGLLSSKAQPVTVRSISGSSLELEWTGSEQGRGTTLFVYDARSGKCLATESLEQGIDSYWVRDLEKGEYRFKVQEKIAQGAVKDLGIREIKVMSKRSGRSRRFGSICEPPSRISN